MGKRGKTPNPLAPDSRKLNRRPVEIQLKENHFVALLRRAEVNEPWEADVVVEEPETESRYPLPLAWSLIFQKFRYSSSRSFGSTGRGAFLYSS